MFYRLIDGGPAEHFPRDRAATDVAQKMQLDEPEQAGQSDGIGPRRLRAHRGYVVRKAFPLVPKTSVQVTASQAQKLAPWVAQPCRSTATASLAERRWNQSSTTSRLSAARTSGSIRR